MQRNSLLVAALLASSSICLWAQQSREITVIPVMLTVTVDSAKTQAGQPITAKIMEDVPLPDGQDIPAGARMVGHVSRVVPATGNAPSSLALQFERISFRGHDWPIRANLRAMASMMAVYDAQVPVFEPDTTPRSAIMLAPVGGEAAFRPDDPEKDARRLVRFSGDLPAGCGGRIDQEVGTGALWVFSPYACGVYGFGKAVVIVQDGSTEVGSNIVLGSRKNFSVHAGSGFLLRVGYRSPWSEAAAQ